MKFLMIIVIAAIIAACVGGTGPARPTVNSGSSLERYETPEVVCFSTDGEHSLWCYRK
jgi:hypothetical protein